MIRIVTSLLLLCTLNASCQKETWNWYFGKYAGLDFSTNPPNVLTGALNGGEGCATVSGAYGNLLFYTESTTVWNKNHQVMANGTGLLGDPSSVQAAVIVLDPANSDQYYVFTVSPTNGLRYSKIDMLLAAGLGSVTIKNQLLYTPCTEQLSAVRGCSGSQVWVLAHEKNSRNFCAFSVGSSGVNTTPVVSTIGPYHAGQPTFAAGALKFSPNGRKVADVFKNASDTLTIYDFDLITGVLSNSLVLSTDFGYGVEFSSDGTKLYCTRNTSPHRIWQWDLCAGNSQAVVSSQYLVYAQSMTPTPNGTPYMLQLAANGKIYVAAPSNTPLNLGVINSPNFYGAACNYSPISQSTGSNLCQSGLPGFMTSLLKQIAPDFTFTSSCLSATFSAGPQYSVMLSCSASNYSVSGIQWDFGDPQSGSANSSTLDNPVHQFTSPGTYSVKLAYADACGADTLRQSVTVGTPPSYSVTGPGTVCAGQQATISTSNQANAEWYETATSATLLSSGPSITTQTLAAGTYTYFLATPGCTHSASRMPFTFTVSPLPNVSVSPAQPTICTGNVVKLTASGASNYLWSSTSQTASISVGPTTNTVYSVVGTSTGGCQASRSVSITVQGCLSVDETHDSPIKIYPNPQGEIFFIESAIATTARITDIQGRLVLEKPLAIGVNSLDWSKEPEGCYLLFISASKEVIKLVRARSE
jgi:PKD repeat protein